MGLLAPLFLLGLVGLVVPVLVHLTERQRRTVVDFPSLMFLRKIPFRSTQRRRIHHWTLLSIRALALLLLVAAFSRPFFENTEVAIGATLGPREVVVVLDRSYSMGYGDRWERAKTRARQVFEGLEPSDRASLVFMGRGAEALLRATSDRERLLAALDTASISDDGTVYGPALKLAQTILEESELPNREAVIISDFQRSGWNGDEGVSFPFGTVIEPVLISDDSTPNATVASVTLQRDFFSGQERMTATARLFRREGDEPVDRTILLELDGQEVQTQTVTLDPTGSATVTFQPFTLSDVYTRGSIRLDSDALTQDNELHFVLSPGRAMRVLVLEGANPRENVSLYLETAHASEESSFQVEVRSSSTFSTEDLETTDVVVLNDIPFPQGNTEVRLRRFVEAGGGLLLVLGERSAWRTGLEEFLPGRFGPARDYSRGAARLGFLDYPHPVFELFAGPGTGDFTRARFFRSRDLQVSPEGQVLARFDDGSVALAERLVGEGSVMVWTSTMDAFWNDLAVQPVFLPFIHQLMYHLGKYRDQVPWFTAGQVLDIADPDGLVFVADRENELSPETDQVALTPGGGSIALPATVGPRFLELDEQGFYEVRPPGTNPDRVFSVAVNVDVAESELEAMDPTELAGAVASRQAGDEVGAGGETLTPEMQARNQERRQSLWRLLMVAALVLLLAETAISNWISRAATMRFEDGRSYVPSSP
ncbi:MAG TPA: VWA domain-containing protein [Gemmatimonadetes bacterium]|nr:VWA domain-containing protein [Gemmatimonadota bacterium]